MFENIVVKVYWDSFLISKSKWVIFVIIVFVVGFFIISMVLGVKKISGGEEGFGGIDDVVVEVVEKVGVKKWIKLIFELNFFEVEFGFFVFQVVLGVGIVGYVLGCMSGCMKGCEEVECVFDFNSVDDVLQVVVIFLEDMLILKL